MHTMIFKAPGPHKIHGHQVDYKVVPDADVAQHVDDGWTLTAIEAGERHAASLVEAAQATREAQERVIAEDLSTKPPTREELEAKAGQLGLAFGPKVSDKKLRELIDAAIKPEEKA